MRYKLSVLCLVAVCAVSANCAALGTNVTYNDKVWLVENESLRVEFVPETAEISVADKKTGYTWRQGRPAKHATPFTVDQVEKLKTADGSGIKFNIKSNAVSETIEVQMTLVDKSRDLRFELQARPGLDLKSLHFPYPFIYGGKNGFNLCTIAGKNGHGGHGIMEAASSNNPRYGHYGDYNNGKSSTTGEFKAGWALTMPWAGAVDTENGHGYIVILETPDDSGFRLLPYAVDQTEYLGWQSILVGQKGKFGYNRKLRYVFSNEGGYNSLCKIYRQYAIEHGDFVSMKHKMQQRPILKDYAGSAYFPIALEKPDSLLKTGRWARRFGYRAIFNTMWSRCKENSSYVWKFDKLGVRPGFWSCFKDIVPKDEYEWSLLLDKNSTGWPLGDGAFMWSVCPTEQKKHADTYLPHLVKTSQVNMIMHDTTACGGLWECYNKNHPVTRSEDKKARIDLLRYINSYGKGDGVVVATEGAKSWAVPVVDALTSASVLEYHPTKMPDAMVAVPLFDLVFHDAVMAQFTWCYRGDHLEWLRAMDMLYGATIPSFGFIRSWDGDLDLLKRSAVVARFYEQVSTKEMLSHEFLTADGMVQKCNFADNTFSVVNFSGTDYKYHFDGKDYLLAKYGYIAKSPQFFAASVKASDGAVEYFQSPTCFSFDSDVPYETDWIKAGSVGASVSFVATGPHRLLVTVMKPGTISFAPGVLQPGWDVSTTRLYQINKDDERIGSAPLQPTPKGMFTLKTEDKNQVFELVCDQRVSVADFKLSDDEIIFSNTAPYGGDDIVVSAVVHNNGLAGGDCLVSFYSDLMDHEHSFGSKVITVAAGQSQDVKMTLDTSLKKWGESSLVGRHNIWVVAESDEDLLETNLINNAASSFINIGPLYHAKYLVKGFDFGRDSTEQGFIGVVKEPYTKQQGWGWTSASDLNDIKNFGIKHRHPSGRAREHGGTQLAEEGSLMSDMVAFPGSVAMMSSYKDRERSLISRDYTFNIDIANGRYELALLMVNGERPWQTEKMLADIYVEGQLKINHEEIKHRKGHFVLTIPVEVTDGQINISFKGRWWQLSAITVRHEKR